MEAYLEELPPEVEIIKELRLLGDIIEVIGSERWKETLKIMYVDEGMSIPEIAITLSKGHTTIGRGLHMLERERVLHVRPARIPKHTARLVLSRALERKKSRS